MRLEKAAQRNGHIADEYTERVRETLRTIESLAKSKDLNIEIREYSASAGSSQQFRLMFLNDDICLLSWTVWDKSEGRDNPQIVLSKSGRDKPERTMYRALMDNFEDRWEAASDQIIFPRKN